MAVFRVEKNDSYTVMSNHHLRDKSLSLKAKGLLSQILSLPDDWDYTLRGLATINKEGIDSVRAAINELESGGYIIRSRERNEQGQLQGNEYIVYEKPPSKKIVPEDQTADSPMSEKPTLDFPIQANPTLDNPTQYNKESKNKELKKYQSINQSLGDTINSHTEGIKEIDTIERKGDSLESVKENIEYEILSKRHSKDRIDEMVALIASVLNSRKDTIRIAGDNLPADEVKKRFREINQFHVEYVLDCIDQNRTEVRNIKQYLLTTLYNAPMTMDHYYTALVNSHYYGQKNKY